MSKVAVVFWSATGNTETMANCVAEGANGTIVPCSEMNAAKLAEFDAVAFGCPAMGAEQLEESEFEPMFSDLEGSLNGKKIALFGSYGWGDGQWMRDWVERAQGDGAQVLNGEGLICNEAPDDDVQAANFHAKAAASVQNASKLRQGTAGGKVCAPAALVSEGGVYGSGCSNWCYGRLCIFAPCGAPRCNAVGP